MVCVVLSPMDVQNLILAELWLEKWGISSSDTKVQIYMARRIFSNLSCYPGCYVPISI